MNGPANLSESDVTEVGHPFLIIPREPIDGDSRVIDRRATPCVTATCTCSERSRPSSWKYRSMV